MKPPSDPTTGAGGSDKDKDTGLPWPRSWRGVYLFVVVVFVVWVSLLTAFMRAFA
jgi:hypothetical protein